MKMRRSRHRKKLITSRQVEVWTAGVSSGPSYEAFTIPTPRGLSTIGTPVITLDTSLTGRKRPASDAEQTHDSASFGTLLQHVVVERGDKDGSFACQPNSLVGGVGSARPLQQASSTGVKQIVLRLSGVRQSPATSGEPSSVKLGEPVMIMGTDAESQHELWSNATECIENRQNDHIMNSSQGATVRVLHPAVQIPGDRGPKEEFAAQKENIKLGSAVCGDDSGGCMGNLPPIDKSCCVLDSSNGQARSGFGQELPTDSFPHPTNPSWILNANPCNACAATRFTTACTFQQGVPRAVHYISGDDVMVYPAPWVHEGREESYQMPDPVYPPGHCNGFADDLDMETQRHVEEQIAQEILLLSQKLANLQARYGARRPVQNSTKPAVLSCPLTPLLLDISRRDVKSNPRALSISSQSISDGPGHPRPGASSSSKIIHRQPESRCQLDERKLGAGRNCGTNIKAASSIPAQSSNRRSDSGVQTTSFNANKNYPHSRAGLNMSGNSATGSSRGSAAQNGPCQPMGAANELAPIAQGCEKVFRDVLEVGKSSKNSRTFSSPHRKRRDRQTEQHVDEECSYSDDMKDLLKTTGGPNVQGYPNGGKRFDWVKTFRTAGVRENQGCSDFASQLQGKASSPHQELSDELECVARDTKAPTSVSKAVQTGRTTSAEDTCAKTSEVILEDRHDSESRLKRRFNSSSIENRPGKSGKRTLSPEEMGGLDSRINYHLLKAGLRRAPSLWKTGPGSRPARNALRVKKKTFGSRSPRKDGGKRLRTRTFFDKAYSAKVVPHEEKVREGPPRTRECQDGVDVQWQSEVADCEAEYETFVENTDVGLHDSEEDHTLFNVKREVPTSEEEQQKRSIRSASGISTPEAKAKLSEAPVLSLMKTPQAPKKTFIRCIDLVVATKKKNQLSKLNGRKASGVRYSYRKIDCSKSPLTDGCGLDKDCRIKPQINEGVVWQNTEAAEEQSLPKPNMDDNTELDDPSSTLTTMDTQHFLLQESKVQDQAANIAFQEHSELNMTKAHEDAAPSSTDLDSSSVVAQVSNLASVLSRVIPKQMESMDAAQLRARWEELIDALEKERLGLPKIKTSSSSSRKIMGVTTRSNSPRDSGGVKRIAEQMKTTLRAANLEDHVQKEKDIIAQIHEDAKGRPLWSKVEQKHDVVF